MGLDINGTRFVLYARSLGVDYARTATIGRQDWRLGAADLRMDLRRFGHRIDPALLEYMSDESRETRAEALFGFLGAQDVHSFDNSDYEGATHIHDMNTPIPATLKKRYSAVLDGGSLEHIFNLPVAMKNCMELVDIGGHFLAITPANNFMGHGFYQFSPELFFSVFTRANGYALRSLIAYEDVPDAKWYAVRNPAEAGGRVMLINSRPVNLLVIAQRVEDVEPFRSMPYQSDYVATWHRAQAGDGARPPAQRRSALRRFASRYLPGPVKRLARGLLGTQPFRSGFRPESFTPLDRRGGKEPATPPQRTR